VFSLICNKINNMKTFYFYSRLTGISIILMSLLFGVIMTNIYNTLFTLEINGIETYIKSSTSYEWGVFGWLIILMLDIIVSIGVYQIYRVKNEFNSKISMLFRLIYSSILGLAIYFLITPLFSKNIDMYFEGIKLFQVTWAFGLIIFGFHLITLSKLVCDKKWINKFFAGLILIAGICYIITNSLQYISSDLSEYQSSIEMIFMLPMVLGEAGWGISLLFKKDINLK